MTEKAIPETIENRWDILYRDFPEIYDAFAKVPKQPTAVEVIQQHFPMDGKTVLDVGSGTGMSSFELAAYADSVIGIEPEAAMRQIALQAAQAQGIANVRFLDGAAEELPLEDASVDMVTAITLASLHVEENIVRFILESGRVVRRGGIVLALDLAPRWYGGDLAPVILDMPRKAMPDEIRDKVFLQHEYDCLDFFQTQDYGTVERAVKTYGFIFGRNAIDHIRVQNKTVIKWKIRIHYKRAL